MYRQFVPSEGKKLSTLVVGGLVAISSGRDISNHVHHLKKMKNCKRIKRRYRDWALEHHPDKGGEEKDFVALTEAKEEALETCTNEPVRLHRKKGTKHKGAKQNKNAKHSTSSAKKRGKRERKKNKQGRKRESRQTSESHDTIDKKAVLGGLLVLGGGIGLLRRTDGGGHRRLRRQNSAENYKRVTGHARRNGN
jgi:hypothetical protein